MSGQILSPFWLMSNDVARVNHCEHVVGYNNPAMLLMVQVTPGSAFEKGVKVMRLCRAGSSTNWWCAARECDDPTWSGFWSRA